MSTISFAEARNNQKNNLAPTWHAEGKTSTSNERYAFDRLGSDFFEVHCVPRFNLPADGAYFMIGSCFARGLESVLANNGFNVLSVSKEFDRFAHSGVGTPLGATNRYNTGSILNEFKWALDPSSPFPDQAVVDIDDTLSVDAHMNPTLKLADRETTLHRRAVFTRVMRELATADVVIITLGLVEAWYDTHLGIFTNVTPDPRIIRKQPDRFVFRRLTYAENMDNLTAIHGLLTQFGKPGHKIIVTVSPVPLMTTFTNEDVVVANTYSKSTLRAVATDFTAQFNNVDYFPSYEIVMNTNPSVAWIPDKRHVRGELANKIMKFFIRTWMVEGQHRDIVSADLRSVY